MPVGELQQSAAREELAGVCQVDGDFDVGFENGHGCSPAIGGCA
jgi:hypothetical protein